MLGDTVNERVVCILLECNLVLGLKLNLALYIFNLQSNLSYILNYSVLIECQKHLLSVNSSLKCDSILM